MASLVGSSSAQYFFKAIMVVGLFCMTNTMALGSEIAPTSQLQAGDGFAMPISGAALCSSVLASFVFMMQ
ncbi:hypothetical protein Lal_00018338 [Lupinus albus]|uniref:Uncharacterized protein n=1 Tax=Lupinus albus TaxID=3870 RepID=A0A6A5M8G3_LUPAL|nr:hypothetical protein Lalb_Chr25g0287461 [Lupinus albus]KAF1866952.1 hypothetical protein Lal_00018338 [Lupinus albus]